MRPNNIPPLAIFWLVPCLALFCAVFPSASRAAVVTPDDMPMAYVSYRPQDQYAVTTAYIDLGSGTFANATTASAAAFGHPEMTFASSSFMSLTPAPNVRLSVDAANIPASWVDPFQPGFLGDQTGFNYSFAVISQLGTFNIDAKIDYNYSMEIVGNGFGDAAIGVGPSSSDKGSALSPNVLFARSGSSVPTTSGSFIYSITTNTVYDVFMKINTWHNGASSKVSVFIDPVITPIVPAGYSPQDFTLLESPGAGNTATPEPGSMLLLGVGAAGAAVMNRRAKRNGAKENAPRA